MISPTDKLLITAAAVIWGVVMTAYVVARVIARQERKRQEREAYNKEDMFL